MQGSEFCVFFFFFLLKRCSHSQSNERGTLRRWSQNRLEKSLVQAVWGQSNSGAEWKLSI